MLKNNFHINKIVSILLLGVLFFNLFYFINPQEAKALRENEVQTLFCTGDELKPYTGAGNFHMNDTGCGILEKLAPRTNKIDKNHVKKISDTEYEIKFSWKIPIIYEFQNTVVNQFIIYVRTLLGGRSKTDWIFDNYELWINDGVSNPTINDISNFKQENNEWVYVHKINFREPPKDNGNLIQFTLVAKHHRTYGFVTGIPSDLWVYGTPQSITITPDGVDENTSYYAPIIVSADGRQVDNLSIATLKWKIPQVVKDNPEILSKYVFKRKRSNQTNWNVEEQEFSHELNYQEAGFVVGNDSPVRNLQPGQSLSFDYFVIAKYNSNKLPNDFRIPANFGWSPMSRRITFTKNPEGELEVIDEGNIDPINNDVITGQTPDPGTPDFPLTGKCAQTHCKGDMGRFPADMVCQALCWVNEAVIGFVMWAFEILKGAISTNTKEPYQPRIDQIFGSGTGSGGGGSGGDTGGGSTGGDTGGGSGSGDDNTGNETPSPFPEQNIEQCLENCYEDYFRDYSSCGEITSCRNEATSEYEQCESNCQFGN